ncbi:MAG TPA: xylose isomerase, partial [Verrucomicrobia bacterium]|nr:xylose isomerase [Verrucomicrobiota bacterium]
MNHLTYCLNVHPGESWAEVFASIREKAMAVRDRVQRRAGIPAR